MIFFLAFPGDTGHVFLHSRNVLELGGITMSFIEAFGRLKICLFRYVFCRNLAKLVILAQFNTSVVNNGLRAAIFTADK